MTNPVQNTVPQVNVSDTNLCKTWHHNAQMGSSCQNQFLVRVRGSEPVFPLT